MKKRILFITQDLARTGSEMVLWYLLKNLNRAEYSTHVLCLRKGELFDLLPDHIGKEVLYKSSPKWSDRALRRVLKFFGKDPVVAQIDRIMHAFKADIWYINTIVIPEVYDIAKQHQVKIITHVHELLYAFTFVKAASLKKVISYSDICIGCSDEVCEKLADFNHPNIQLQYSFIDATTIHTNANRIATLRSELGILPTDFVWIVSGGATYMKGLDCILPILAHFKGQPIKIIWIGKLLDDGLEFYVRSVADSTYPNQLIFTGPLSEDYYNYMALGNGLLLLSREESFSLVMIEAAFLGIPTVGFNVGIAASFIADEGMGQLIENRNLQDLMLSMQKLHEQPRPDRIGLKQMAMQYDLTQQLPKFEALLNRISLEK